MFNWLDREAAASGYINCTRIARGGFGPGGLSNRGSTVGGDGRWKRRLALNAKQKLIYIRRSGLCRRSGDEWLYFLHTKWAACF